LLYLQKWLFLKQENEWSHTASLILLAQLLHVEVLWRDTAKHKVIVKSFTKCEISNDIDGAEDMYLQEVRKFRLTVMIMCVWQQ
jgi:hypothetical protein